MSKPQTKAEKAHVNNVAELGCVACYIQFGEWGTPGQIHHPRDGQGLAQRSSWGDVICLCPDHHLYGESGKLAYHRGAKTFEAAYGKHAELLDITHANITAC